MKTKTHILVVKVHFDKPCTKTHARKEFADNVHGTFYPTAREKTDPETFKIGAVRTAKVTP